MKYLMMITVVMSLGISSVGATTSPVCGPREKILEELLDRYGEVPYGMGLVDGTNIIEILVSPKTKSWSLLVSSVIGQSCLVSSGTDWTRPSVGETRGDL